MYIFIPIVYNWADNRNSMESNRLLARTFGLTPGLTPVSSATSPGRQCANLRMAPVVG